MYYTRLKNFHVRPRLHVEILVADFVDPVEVARMRGRHVNNEEGREVCEDAGGFQKFRA